MIKCDNCGYTNLPQSNKCACGADLRGFNFGKMTFLIITAVGLIGIFIFFYFILPLSPIASEESPFSLSLPFPAELMLVWGGKFSFLGFSLFSLYYGIKGLMFKTKEIV